ncbi:MAG: hypothetical protein M1840_000688 [Geoglossum simile]|nr:MAG: hypothetical protein M1840_000688 [Geoglossum simile]
MVPVACEMARYRRNAVHFILLGRYDISIEELLLKNGVRGGCDVHWHDGRPSHSVSSTEFRMETSVFEALSIVSRVLNLQVLIVNNLEEEDKFFVRSIRTRAHSLGKPIIELPKGAAQDLMWMTRLDCGSLRAWNNINIEIIVQVAPGESGSLIRLLKSLRNADYFSSPPPGVTVELPPSIDKPTLQFLEGFAWPPSRPGGRESGRLRLRRRFRHDATAEEASIRFLESFLPANPSTTHILILSPRVELSPLFYHYLKYALLEHKYSSYGFQVSSHLIGIALNLPSTHPNTSLPFDPPLIEPRPLDRGRPIPEADQATPFLWQAPGSDAALYFGEKWVEFQEFLSARLDAFHQLSDPPQGLKETNPEYPPWMGYMSELSRARGYLMLYPNWESGGSFATVHSDPVPHKPNFIGDDTPYPSTQPLGHPRREIPLITRTTLVRILPADGDLPELSSVPILSFDGHRISRSTLDVEAAGYAADFRKEVGRCDNARSSFDIESSDIGDLFCLYGE